MATSSIFASVEINDPQKVELFIRALESSEKAVKSRPAVKSCNSSILRDSDSIRQFLEIRKKK